MSKRAALHPYMRYYINGITEQGIRLKAVPIHRLQENTSVD